jgi:putative transposase
LSQHREVIVAADFFTIEAWTRNGLTRFLVLFLIDLSSRRVQIAGVTRHANRLWMNQMARNLSDATEGFLIGKRYLIHDRDPLFTEEFLKTVQASGIESVKLPPSSPNLNAHAERFVRTIKESCLDRLLLFGEGSLRKAITEFVVHYHQERNHQGLGNRLIMPEQPGAGSTGTIQCRQRLGGMLNFYHRQAA